MPPTVTLEDAVDTVRAGYVAAFRTLVEATEQMAYAVAWSVIRSEPDARDVVRQAYLAAFERLRAASQWQLRGTADEHLIGEQPDGSGHGATRFISAWNRRR